MKIAMVGQFPPHFGGVGVHIHTLAKKLVSQGHEVYVITYPHNDLKDIDGIHVIGAKSVPIPGLRGLLFAQSARKALEELVNEVDIDIIHGHYLFPAGYAAVKVGKKYNIPTYVTAHGSDMFEVYAKQSFMRPVLRRVLAGADVVLAVSEALKGIRLIKQEESYSSQCSPYAGRVCIENAEKSNRKERGLYITKGEIFNADAVGAYNIMKKYFAVSGIKKEMSVKGLKNIETIKVAV